MNGFPVTVDDVKKLVERKLLDSAEYWSSILIQENNLNPQEKCARYLLYADCLYNNSKYSDAAYYYQHSYSLLNTLLEYPDRETNQTHVLFQLYMCEYMAANDKWDRKMLQMCLYYLEEIKAEHRSISIRMHLARLHWSMNNYAKAQENAQSVLQEEPLAMEAIEILSRIRDYKGLRDVDNNDPPIPSTPPLSLLTEAELFKYSNPQESIISYNKLTDYFLPSPLFTLHTAICHLALHQIPAYLQSIEKLQRMDPSLLYKPYYVLASLLAQHNSLPYSHPSITMSEMDMPAYLTQLKQTQSAHLVVFFMECILCRSQDLHVLEQNYWNLINHFPCYSSYRMLIQFYLDESMHPKAMTLASQLQKNNPQSVYANILLARVYMVLPTGLYQAEAYLRKGLNIDPTHREACYLLAKLLYGKGNYKGAIEILGKVLAEEVTPEMKALLCECYLKNGDSIPYLKMLHTLYSFCYIPYICLIERFS